MIRRTPGLVAGVLLLVAGGAGAQIREVETPRQQCRCGGTYIEVPRGRDCGVVCMGQAP